MIDCIEGKTTPINDLTDGIYTLKVALAVKKSSKLKKTLLINK
jgi:hypothetical protein